MQHAQQDSYASDQDIQIALLTGNLVEDARYQDISPDRVFSVSDPNDDAEVDYYQLAGLTRSELIQMGVISWR